ncbi:phosphate/phosphite/phosphonate ABC transporter substrate-binding protein [Neptunomonas antarctica]|uniref:Phosphonate transport system substrate-binding protein n=1 Tax=Neptunomonas antarctica TaxID=619304 RepID=A0A1N7K7L0_9GAMM|nr:phosphate/phosphite/phosphonate ABC transporter substrate-binding protein [Neptunomonas antarctica]SIS57569.1 phosphonate transport system substrate-binding protein [Neptunomonas antarctica]
MRLLIILIFWTLSAASTAIYAAQSDADKVYTVGVVPQFEVRKIHTIWRPTLDLLEEKTGYRFILRGSASIPEFEQEFIEGKFDFAYMNPYHLVIANEHAGYIPLVRDHGHKLHGVLVVKKDSGITDPSQLKGKTLAFPSPNALGASLQMRQELHDNFGINFTSNFVKTHDSVYLNVLLNEADAGGGVQKTLNSQKDQYKEMLRVIYKTTGVEPHPFAALPEVPVEVRNRVRDALLEIGQSKEGRKLLAEIPINSIGPARMDDYLPLKLLNLNRFYVEPHQ